MKLKTVCGGAISPYIDDIARLRTDVFREFPYLYDGSPAYEERYLAHYARTARSVVVLALDDGHVVGASSGLPLEDDSGPFVQPLTVAGYDPAEVFYCAESVLLAAYRGSGLYRSFFDGRESHARELGFDICAFCAVERPDDHPLRPAAYTPLDEVWRYFGYRKMPALQAVLSWQDVDRPHETEKSLTFWLKDL
ncbi:GNAT family acetyltransferase [Granulosicoccaceae sp. 1_MG-2023]|nr:GNAT family acetyltransferase [Granulosicoccaceae sp. 1_MG-2023]